MEISDYIPEYNEYKNKEKFEEEFDKVHRWHGDLKMPEGEYESDLGHTRHMLEIAKTMFDNMPELAMEISLAEVYRMILVHDVSEIVVGDAEQELSMLERDAHDEKERKYGLMLFNGNPKYKELFRRSFDNESEDKEAKMCKIIDKIQAGIMVVDYLADRSDPKTVIENIEQYTLKHAMKVFQGLAPLLSLQAKAELLGFLQEYQLKSALKVKELKKKIK